MKHPVNYLQAKQITLQHDQNSIELGFVALSYACPAANQYAYKMENLDKDWIFTRDNQSVTYANLAPGKYRFVVKASNNDKVWNQDGLLSRLSSFLLGGRPGPPTFAMRSF